MTPVKRALLLKISKNRGHPLHFIERGHSIKKCAIFDYFCLFVKKASFGTRQNTIHKMRSKDLVKSCIIEKDAKNPYFCLKYMKLNTFLIHLPLALALLAFLQPNPCFGQLRYEISLSMKEASHSGGLAGTIKTLSGFKEKKTCYYLPLNDPHHRMDIARGMSPSALKYGRAEREAGSITVVGAKMEEFLTPYLLQTAAKKLPFLAKLPKWPGGEQDRWFFNGFYPIPLLNCPKDFKDPFSFEVDRKSRIKITHNKEASYALLHAGEEDKKGNISFQGPSFSFLYAKKKTTYTKSFLIKDTTIQIAGFSEGFKELIPAIKPLFSRTYKLLGPFPYKKLLITETEDLEKSLTPGIVTINREKQRPIDAKTKNPIRWHLWQLANFLPQQWVGVSLKPQKMADFWFHKGLSDLIAYAIVKDDKDYDDFFAKGEDALFKFSFKYRQAQDLVAGVLTFLHPFNALTDFKGVSKDALKDQHSFGYIRNSLALRYLYWYLGPKEFAAMMAQFIKSRKHSPTTGADFIAFLKKRKPPQGEKIAKMVLDFWQKDTWPDFYIEDVLATEKNGKKSVKVLVGQNEPYKLDVDITVKDENGKEYRKRARLQKGAKYLTASFQIESELASVHINPEKQLFDWNRFNNQNLPPKFQFYPGNAKSLEDDVTTVIWLPLLAKLPGEDLSLIFSSVMLRYLQSIYATMLSYVPSEGRLGFQGFFLTDLPKYGLFTVLRAAQDFGNSLRGERLLEAGLYRAPFLFKEPLTEVGVRLRSRRELGIESTLHQTITARLKMIPLNPGRCHYKIMSDLETTPGKTKGGYAYTRNYAMLQSNCRVFGLDLGARGFYGKIQKSGTIPGSVLFKPQNEDEARMRIDSPSLASVASIKSLGLDILWPARLPLSSELFLLPREARWRLFYDEAKTLGPDSTIKDAGAGLLVPVGGDAVGKKSISILQFSFLAVLFREYDGQKDYRPGILIDFLGKL